MKKKEAIVGQCHSARVPGDPELPVIVAEYQVLPPDDGRPSTSTRRLSSARIRSLSSATSATPSRSRLRQARAAIQAWNTYCIRAYRRMTPLQRVLAGLAILALYALIILGFIFSRRLFDWLATVSASWRALPGGWLIAFALVFVTAFPPVIGYSTATTISGFVYGFPGGWPIAATACTAGSLAAFIASRTVLSRVVDRMVGHDKRFIALGHVLRRDGIWYLTGIRFCPLPFSLSNGFLATIPSISPLAFTISTALSSPKLLVHVFIGSRLAILAENGDKLSFGDRLVNYLSILLGAAVGITVGWVIYKRTMARAAELALEENVAAAEEEGRAGVSSPYLDTEDTLVDPEDAAALMSDDDLSLWETQFDEDAERRRSSDDDDDGPAAKKTATVGAQNGEAGWTDRSW
ncbi:Golgi apparatus membrane protein-like protein [Hapsidospora chrysogenum ATCC 11550]|uniref:Golgi apparatus membrane protein TVP38 n=1 Tax=Hapsidospora chrysogenum (strain ATCC 11550 / CBS 779.69 / DSM 880 / IAM 14645 / JCM 23072 / IMI 49137) TaxID=857340 RepID=A0A086TEY1_HAPC1|nr:Golgi apparatus membrane protein-like protein [Hapsidospora chrysogenum ATCC 11550]